MSDVKEETLVEDKQESNEESRKIDSSALI